MKPNLTLKQTCVFWHLKINISLISLFLSFQEDTLPTLKIWGGYRTLIHITQIIVIIEHEIFLHCLL